MWVSVAFTMRPRSARLLESVACSAASLHSSFMAASTSRTSASRSPARPIKVIAVYRRLFPSATTPAGVAINTKHVKTEVLVENGGTVVIGGIFEQTERTDITRVPWFGELPVIGWLFKNTQTNQQKTELLVFITPRIVNERMTIR